MHQHRLAIRQGQQVGHGVGDGGGPGTRINDEDERALSVQEDGGTDPGEQIDQQPDLLIPVGEGDVLCRRGEGTTERAGPQTGNQRAAIGCVDAIGVQRRLPNKSADDYRPDGRETTSDRVSGAGMGG